MASPSPLDLCWKVKDAPGSSPILPAVRAAVERHWPETLRNAASVLRDETLAAEIMEAAIEKAVAYLVDRPPENHEDVSFVLSRFCREEIGRRRKDSNKLVFIDCSRGILSRVLQKDEFANVTLFGFAAGERLATHAVPTPAILCFVEGEGIVQLGDDSVKSATNL